MNNVVELPGSQPLPENPLDEHDRSVTCRECGAVLDPFDFLVSNAKVISRAWTSHRCVMAQVKQREETVEALRKEEKRLRALVKRLQQKVPSVSLRPVP